MFRNAHFDRARQMFADQFKPDGTAFLYRKGLKGPPIRVSEAERDEFVVTFGRQLRTLTWTLVVVMMALIILIAILITDIDAPQGEMTLYIAMGAVLAPFMLGYFRIWNRPARHLERRPAEGNALTREEVKRLMFARMTYGQLGFVVFMAILLLWNAAGERDVRHGWGLVWPTFSAALILLASVQTIRKWRSDRSR